MHLRGANAKLMYWKNGGGVTTEIARHPDEGDFDWRISIAEIGTDGAFSLFPKVSRVLMLLDGNGIELDFSDGGSVRLDCRFQQHAFSGETPTFCRLIDGPTRDFNLMLRGGAVQGALYARPLVGPLVFFAEANVIWLVHVVNGRVAAKDRPNEPALDPGDTLMISSDANDTAPLVLVGTGEVVLAKIVPLRH